MSSKFSEVCSGLNYKELEKATRDNRRRCVLEPGDVLLIRLTSEGTETHGERPCVVVSSKEYNRITGNAIVCPITSKYHEGYLGTIEIPNGQYKTYGWILTTQIRTIDVRARRAQLLDHLGKDVMRRVLHQVNALMKFC